jgi:sulfatase modifying factor 1
VRRPRPRTPGLRTTRPALALLALASALLLLGGARPKRAGPARAPRAGAPSRGDAPDAGQRGCPPEMIGAGAVCVDRWEASMVDKASGEPLSPYYPPEPRLLREVWQAWDLDRVAFGSEGARRMPIPEIGEWQRTHAFEARAVSRPNVVPQAYLPYPIAKRACENAGKRLCTREEWTAACKGQGATKFPYGEAFDQGKCNVWGHLHPGVALHQGSSFGHRDPRLNLVEEGGDTPLLHLTGATPACASRWGSDAAYDMVGNVDEWVDGDGREPRPEFVGGFYARSTSSGCASRITTHAPMYYDYALGVRCCRDASE